MRILFVADGRSPIALNWIHHFTTAGHEVHLVSTFGAAPSLPLASFQVVPVAFSSLKASSPSRSTPSRSTASGPRARKSGVWGAASVRFRTMVRHWFGLLTLPRSASRLTEIARQVRPDLVHAMRIPYEGMLASRASLDAPLLISVWGNDFTLHAASNPWMASATRRALISAGALHTDCHRDLRLAEELGFSPQKPQVVLPGGGGVRSDIFFPPGTPQVDPVAVNPRGFRAYVRSDAFFRAIPLVLHKFPSARFLCPDTRDEPQAHRWVSHYRISHAVELLPKQDLAGMAAIYRRSSVLVSPSTHDGTPNTLLEGLACGCFPVAGDLESIREWITPGENGLLVDPGDPVLIAEAILAGFKNREMRQRAREKNLRIVNERAEYSQVMDQAENFYRQLLQG